MRSTHSVSAICLLAISLSSSARADIIFSGTSQTPTGGIFDPKPGSDTDYTIPDFSLTVTPYQVTYTMIAPASAHAVSLLLSDFVAFGYTPFGYPVGTASTGSGSYQALLNYTVTVGGSFGGTGAQSNEDTTIDTSIGSILNTSFSKSYSNSINGGAYTLSYGFSPITGQLVVGAGVDVTPNFSIPDYKFDAYTAGFAAARNVWDTATITMTLTELAPAVPEPSYFAAVGAILTALGLQRFRTRNRRACLIRPLEKSTNLR
jgi:hypothetical protein